MKKPSSFWCYRCCMCVNVFVVLNIYIIIIEILTILPKEQKDISLTKNYSLNYIKNSMNHRTFEKHSISSLDPEIYIFTKLMYTNLIPKYLNEH